MVRSVYTASRIAETLNLPVHAWEDAHEEGGIYLDDETAGRQVGQAGKNRAFYEANFPRLVLPDWLGESGWWNRPYETFEQRRPRAQRLLERLMQHHAGTSHRVAVVSHGGFYNHFMAVLLGLAEVGKPWFRLNNGAITRVDFSPEGVVMMYQNRLDYMPAELVT
jgi:broad specificity phosphatase PhoE